MDTSTRAVLKVGIEGASEYRAAVCVGLSVPPGAGRVSGTSEEAGSSQNDESEVRGEGKVLLTISGRRRGERCHSGNYRRSQSPAYLFLRCALYPRTNGCYRTVSLS